MILHDVIYEPEPITDIVSSGSFPWVLLIVLLVILAGAVWLLIRLVKRK
ncbi:MAG: hypothetical protein IJV50_02195 [Lachnospiraceae bacterium]|nr:hypothetical protein [Lachnospiraceae bacterium]